MSVFISGATGYIAKHIVGDLLDQNYKVIGTARSQEKIDLLKKQFGNNPNLQMEIVKDIAQPEAFDAAFKKHAKDIKIVLHTASPFHFDITDYEKDLLVPARNGTIGILNSIKKYGADSVERVVITSSYAAVFDLKRDADNTLVLNEESWNPDTWESCQRDPVSAYCGSKKIAEKAAWDFLNENKNEVKFKLSIVNPVYVFGPQRFDADVSGHLNTSCEIVNQIIHSGKDAEVTDSMCGGFIDVRDVAKAHLLAFQKENTIGKRLILSNGKFVQQDIIDVLNENFPTLKGKIPVGKPHTGAQHNSIGASIDNEKTKQILGFKFKTLKETISDTASQILKYEQKL